MVNLESDQIEQSRMDPNEVLGDYAAFVGELVTCLQTVGINIQGHEIDHIAYTVSSLDGYEAMKRKLGNISQESVESIHNGRPIAKYQLNKPLKIGEFTIPMVELPAPKEGVATSDGLDHFEVVLRNERRFNQMTHTLSGLQGNGDITVNTRSTDPLNPTIAIAFGNQGTVKFHRRPLREVMADEGQRFVRLK